MKSINFLSKLDNNKVLLDLDKIPDTLFIDAYLVRGIYSAKLLSNKEKKLNNSCSPDVVLISAYGEKQMITRKQLIKNYTHPNGSKITLAFLKSGKQYIVQDIKESIPYKVLKLPDNFIGKLHNKKIESGSYIIYKTDENGSALRGTATIVKPKMFKKMFKIPMQPIIKKYINGSNRTVSNIFNKITNTKTHSDKYTDTTNSVSLNKNKVEDKVEFRRRTTNSKTESKQYESKYKFTATHRIVDMHNSNKIKGFMIKDIKTGNSKPLELKQVYLLCKEQLIDNIILVTKENGTNHLRGNNISIENLPEIID